MEYNDHFLFYGATKWFECLNLDQLVGIFDGVKTEQTNDITIHIHFCKLFALHACDPFPYDHIFFGSRTLSDLINYIKMLPRTGLILYILYFMLLHILMPHGATERK